MIEADPSNYRHDETDQTTDGSLLPAEEQARMEAAEDHWLDHERTMLKEEQEMLRELMARGVTDPEIMANYAESKQALKVTEAEISERPAFTQPPSSGEAQ